MRVHRPCEKGRVTVLGVCTCDIVPRASCNGQHLAGALAAAIVRLTHPMRGSFIPLEAVLAGRHPDLGHVYDGQVEGVRCLGMTDAPLVLAWVPDLR
jgi:hypothetical protein